MVDEMLARCAGRIGDRPLRLALGADEQHLAACGRGRRDEVERAREERHGLRQVEDVDAVARAEDVRLNARVPTVGLVAEVGAGLDQILHRDRSEEHTSEIQSIMRNSYAVFCWNKKKELDTYK